MYKILFKTIFALLAVAFFMTDAFAVNLTVDAGTLEAGLSGQEPKNVTSLTLSGTIDVRDLKFISERMTSLEQLDLSGVKIAAYYDREPLIDNICSFDAGIVPAGILAGSNISELTLPSSLKEIGDGAFAGCRKLKTVDFSKSVKIIGDMAFAGAEKLEQLTGCESVEKIGDYAFSRCTMLKSMAFPALSDIGKYAFQSCSSLGSFAFPDGLISIGEGAFKLSGITNVDLSGCKNLSSVGNWAFSDMPYLERASFPPLAKINDGMFFYSTSLNDIVLNRSVTELGDFSFSGTAVNNKNLLPEETVTIGDYALSDSKKLQDLTIPASVDYIGEGAMRNCTSLMAIQSNAIVPPALGDDVWAGVDKSAVTLTVPDMSYAQYRSAPQWQDFYGAASDNIELIEKNTIYSVENGILRISAFKQINSVCIYDTKGLLVVRDDNTRQNAEYDLNDNTERLYMIVCKYDDGSFEIVKIVKK